MAGLKGAGKVSAIPAAGAAAATGAVYGAKKAKED